MCEKRSFEIDFKGALAEKAQVVNTALAEVLSSGGRIYPDLEKAMRYTLDGPGKRLRGALVLWCCEIVCGKVTDQAKAAACAIEMVHTYSLVHDDLPAMDDDDMRRGKASCHKAFDEATAILAGDSLLTLAFDLLAGQNAEPAVTVKLIKILAQAAGPSGMIAGQMADIASANTAGDIEMLEYIHVNKTAKMFAAAAETGAIAGNADKEQASRLREYGLKIGLGFQVADDILDVVASSEQLGKTAGKDQLQGKMTYPSIVGMDESQAIAEKLADEAIETLDAFGVEADILRQLTMELLKRTK
ncbi:MAG: polyprenyl synthetase family protein [Planctomycetes bacterium]|nr:polyprenyl synthetase family protein [Planctomycetota bacterium]